MSSGSTRPVGRINIQWKIGVAFAALALVLFAVVAAASGAQARRQLQTDVGAGLGQLAQRLAAALDTGMFERRREIENLAALEALLGVELDPARWRAIVQRARESLTYYSWIGIADRQGQVLAATDGVLEGRSVAARPWFTKGLGGVFVGDVHDAVLLAKLLPPEANGEPLRLVDFAAPLRRGGEVVGVLGAHLSWAWAEARRTAAQAGVDPARRLEIFVVGANGDILLGPKSEPLAPALRRTEPTLQAWPDGANYLSAAAVGTGYQNYPGLGWTVVVRQPEATAMEAAEALQRRIMLFGLLGAAGFGLLGWALAGWLTAPLRQVAQQARELAGVSAGASQRDEVGQLGSALQSLGAQLEGRDRELGELARTFEERVEARTRTLNEANADLRSFSRTVSHDLKGPIGSIGMLVRHVLGQERDQLSEATKRLLGLVATECDRLRDLVDELLNLAMVEQRALAPVPVSMPTMVEAVLNDLRTAPGSPPAAEIQVDELPEVNGDPVLLRQVWANLIGNALKFSAKAEAARVAIRAERRGDEHVFSVADNGAGFDMAEADRLFGVFQRLHRSSEFPGNGVGLSIVKRIVQRHGGRVWAEGRRGAGATFFFALPVQPDFAPSTL